MLQVKKRAIRHHRKARGYYHLHRSLRLLAHPIDNLSVSMSDCHSTVPAQLFNGFLMYLDTQGDRAHGVQITFLFKTHTSKRRGRRITVHPLRKSAFWKRRGFSKLQYALSLGILYSTVQQCDAVCTGMRCRNWHIYVSLRRLPYPVP